MVYKLRTTQQRPFIRPNTWTISYISVLKAIRFYLHLFVYFGVIANVCGAQLIDNFVPSRTLVTHEQQEFEPSYISNLDDDLLLLLKNSRGTLKLIRYFLRI